jgi:hypothetical protein
VRTKRHPAIRTRRGLALGSAIVTAGLTGAYWIGDLGAATTATSTSTAPVVESDDATSTWDADDPSPSSSFDDDVDVSASVAAPDTTSRAS